MKNEILDTPFHHSFADFLTKGETITWEGQPLLDTKPKELMNAKIIFWIFLSVVVLFYFITQALSRSALVVFIVASLFFIVPKIWRQQRKQNFKYALTQKQILFELQEKWYKKNTFYAIPFSEIKDVIVVMKYDINQMKRNNHEHSEGTSEMYLKEGLEKLGTIFLVPRHPQLIPFETVDFSNNSKRHQPTLELLDDAEAVAEMIRTGIKNAII